MTDLAKSLANACVDSWMASYDSIKELEEAARKTLDDFAALFNIESLKTQVRADRTAEEFAQINEFLEEHGWFAPPSLSPVERKAILARISAGSDACAIIEQELAFCRGGLNLRIIEKAVGCWAFRSRESLLQDAYKAYTEHRFSLCIPVFLSQTEGAYVEALATVVPAAEDRSMLFRRSTSTDTETASWQLPVIEIVLHKHLQAFSRTLSSQVTQSVWSQEDLSELQARYPRGVLSRHGIMHGIDTDYATVENAVKALFLLDVVREILDYLKPANLRVESC